MADVGSVNPATITHGPMFIGIILNIILYGILVSQVHIYYASYSGDKLWMKVLVAFLLIADSLQSIFLVTYMYDAVVLHFNQPAYLDVATWVFYTDPALTGIIAATVQCFFAYRVKVMTGKLWAALIIVAFSLGTLLAGLATSIAAGKIPRFIEWGKFKAVVIVWLVSAAVADVLITFMLVFFLRKKKTGFKRMDSIVDRIIRLTVQTGLITAVAATVNVILFLVSESGLHLAVNLPLCKLYTNSLLSSLNSRGAWNIETSAQQQSSHNAPGKVSGVKPDVVQLAVRHEPSRVHVQVESHQIYDMPDKASEAIYQEEYDARNQKSHIDMPYNHAR